MIYTILKNIVKVGLWVYYKKTVVNAPNLPTHGPLIIVSNHPNTFMDPMIIAARFHQPIGFLANASIFVHPILNAIFKFFHVIPVYRDKDVAPGVKPDNEKTFQACFEFLEARNSLIIFPEGSSYHELKLRKIKTGFGRIALGLEERNGFELGLKILPIGLYYSNPIKFRSKIYMNVGEPIDVSTLAAAYKEDPIAAVQSLTHVITVALEQLTINTLDAEQEALFIKIKRIYKKRLFESSGTEPSPDEAFKITQEIARAIQYFKIEFPHKYSELKDRIDYYNAQLDRVTKEGQELVGSRSSAMNILMSLSGGVYLTIGLPFFLFGLLQNYIPFQLPYWLAKSITKEPEYYAPIMLSFGIFLFPIYYGFSIWIVKEYYPTNLLALSIYAILLPISGYFVLHYHRFASQARSFVKIHSYFSKSTFQKRRLEKIRNQIYDELDTAKRSYLEYVRGI